MKPHQIREMVNELRDVANAFSGTEQLRDRISHVVHRYLEPKTKKLVWLTDRTWEWREKNT